MNTADAVDAFTNLEFDIAAAALAENSAREYEFVVSRDNGSLVVVTIRSSNTGVITFMNRDDGSPMPRTEVFDAFMTMNARRPGAVRINFNSGFDFTNSATRMAPPGNLLERYAEENIANFAAAKGNYY
ncbi:MAG: hypothetical protein ABI876_04305 [Bacteroidota bacterium]